MMMMIMRHNIYTVGRVFVSKRYVRHGSFSDAFAVYGHDFDATSSPFALRHLLSHGGVWVICIV